MSNSRLDLPRFNQHAEEEIESKIESNIAFRQKTEEQQTMLEWQMQKLSEAEIAMTSSGISKHVFLTNKVSRPESKFSKLSRGPMSRSLITKINTPLDHRPFLSKTPFHSKQHSNLQDLRFKNRTLSEKDMQNSSESIAYKHPGPLRPFSGRHTSLANISDR